MVGMIKPRNMRWLTHEMTHEIKKNVRNSGLDNIKIIITFEDLPVLVYKFWQTADVTERNIPDSFEQREGFLQHQISVLTSKIPVCLLQGPSAVL
jgi:hypothetical protein